MALFKAKMPRIIQFQVSLKRWPLLCLRDGQVLDTTDYGRSMKSFFIEIPNFWAWADNLGR